jgi:branched-chain amino acid transport system substrate-binding protein
VAAAGRLTGLVRAGALVFDLAVLLVGHVAAQEPARPIRIGAVSTLSGPSSFPESSQAAKAYFDAVNAAGGIRGRRIQYLSADDRGDPRAAAGAAAQMLADPDVVALAGGSSVVDCPASRTAYEQAGIVSLQGASVAPDCFRSAAIVPMNNGPYTALATAVVFARQQLQARRLCAVALDLPGMVAGYEHALKRLAERHGTAAPPLQRLALGADPRPLLRSLEAEGCDVVIHTGHEPAVLQWLEAARALGLAHITWVFLAPAYTARVATALAGQGMPVYAMAEFEPWSSRSLSAQDWRHLMREAGLPLSSLSQGGYLSAQLLVRALRRIDGPITRASVTAALRGLPPVEHALVGMPLAIGAAAHHNPNRAAMPMKHEGGSWRIAATRWIEVPPVND